MTSSSFQSWWVLFTCRILLRRTLWRISAADCTSLSPNKIISRWNEYALRTALKMKPSGRDSLGHSAPAAWASTKVSLKIRLLVAFHNILNSYPHPWPLSFKALSTACMCHLPVWHVQGQNEPLVLVELFSNSLSRPNLFHWTHLLRSSSTCSIRPKIALTLASPGAHLHFFLRHSLYF